MNGDAIYFERRSREEREAAMKASHPDARQAHLDMADRYAELANAISAHSRPVKSSAAAL